MLDSVRVKRITDETSFEVADEKAKLIYLPFDSGLFLRKMGKIEVISVKEKGRFDNLLDSLLELAKIEEYSHLTARVDSEKLVAANSLESHGFRIMADYIYFMKPALVHNDPIMGIIEAKDDDLSDLIEITIEGFEHRTRFHFDPYFSIEEANQMYIEWVKNSVKKKAADVVFVYKENQEIMGYVAGKIKGEDGHVVLFAVREKHQGKGVGGKLLKFMEHWFIESGCKRMTVGTESVNYGALNVYQKCGFKITRSQFTFHYVLSGRGII